MADVIAIISASKFEQFTPHASQCFEEVPSGKVKYIPKPAKVVPLKADLSVYKHV